MAQIRCLAQLGSFLCLHLTIDAHTPLSPANSLNSRNFLSRSPSFFWCHIVVVTNIFPLQVLAAQHSGTVITHWWKWHLLGSSCLVFPLADISVAPKEKERLNKKITAFYTKENPSFKQTSFHPFLRVCAVRQDFGGGCPRGLTLLVQETPWGPTRPLTQCGNLGCRCAK